MGVRAESYVFIFDLRVGFALGIDGEVFHITGVVAFRIIESVLLAFGIEMWAGGLEIRRFALRLLMEMDGVLAGRKIVEMQLEGDGRSVLRDENAAYIFALGVFEFDFGFGGAGKRGGNQNGDEEEPWIFHAEIIAKRAAPCTNGLCLIHKNVEYTAKKFGIPSGKCNHGFECN